MSAASTDSTHPQGQLESLLDSKLSAFLSSIREHVCTQGPFLSQLGSDVAAVRADVKDLVQAKGRNSIIEKLVLIIVSALVAGSAGYVGGMLSVQKERALQRQVESARVMPLTTSTTLPAPDPASTFLGLYGERRAHP